MTEPGKMSQRYWLAKVTKTWAGEVTNDYHIEWTADDGDHYFDVNVPNESSNAVLLDGFIGDDGVTLEWKW